MDAVQVLVDVHIWSRLLCTASRLIKMAVM